MRKDLRTQTRQFIAQSEQYEDPDKTEVTFPPHIIRHNQKARLEELGLTEDYQVAETARPGVYAARYNGDLCWITEDNGFYEIRINEKLYPVRVIMEIEYPVSFQILSDTES